MRDGRKSPPLGGESTRIRLCRVRDTPPPPPSFPSPLCCGTPSRHSGLHTGAQLFTGMPEDIVGTCDMSLAADGSTVLTACTHACTHRNRKAKGAQPLTPSEHTCLPAATLLTALLPPPSMIDLRQLSDS